MNVVQTPMKNATVHWISFEEGGRKKLPIGPSYVCPVFFPSFMSNRQDVEVTWDLVLTCIGDTNQPKWDCRVQFRNKHAPHDWLSSGQLFDLHEGKKRVAWGIVH